MQSARCARLAWLYLATPRGCPRRGASNSHAHHEALLVLLLVLAVLAAAHVVLQQQQPQPAAAAAPGADTPCLHTRAALDARVTSGLPTLHQLAAAPGTVRSKRAHEQPHRPRAAGSLFLCLARQRVPACRLAAATAADSAGAGAAAEPCGGDAGRLLRVGLRRRDGAVWDADGAECGHGRAELRAETARWSCPHPGREAPLQGQQLVRCQEACSRAVPVAAQALGAPDVPHGERPGRMAPAARRHQLARSLHPSDGTGHIHPPGCASFGPELALPSRDPRRHRVQSTRGRPPRFRCRKRRLLLLEYPGTKPGARPFGVWRLQVCWCHPHTRCGAVELRADGLHRRLPLFLLRDVPLPATVSSLTCAARRVCNGIASKHGAAVAADHVPLPHRSKSASIYGHARARLTDITGLMARCVEVQNAMHYLSNVHDKDLKDAPEAVLVYGRGHWLGQGYGKRFETAARAAQRKIRPETLAANPSRSCRRKEQSPGSALRFARSPRQCAW